ncbi:pentatricopeptide repeat (PPR-like) superfamily protein [Tasmannia lanceolata]|uniref:pentatricopeptide repeat (PPR-like) superfamily protein n=1 Tax=Tasmannia lanceolata TaxID=3420 RepID=UPI0040638C42
MENSLILCKSKDFVPHFSKQEVPYEFLSKPTIYSLPKKCSPLASKPAVPDFVSSEQEISSKYPLKPIISFTKNAKPVSSEPNLELADLHLNHLCRTGQLKEAVIAFKSLAERGAKVKPKTYISLLQSCIDSDSIDDGRKLHALIGSVYNSNPFVETKLVSMYAKCGSLKEAHNVFVKMRERNLFTWSAMIGGYAREQRWEEIIELFFQMMVQGMMPDEFLLPKILQACANSGHIDTGELIHSFAIRSGMQMLVHVSNSLLAMYAKCRKLHSAERVFSTMNLRDRVTWNAMISGYCHCGKNEEALKLFNQMQVEGIELGLVTWNILIDSYNQSGKCDLARELMKKMEKSGIAPDVFTWTTMISGFAQNNRTNQALELFREMWLVGFEPNGVTLASAVSTCTSLKSIKKGTEIHSITVKIGSASDILVGNSLIDMYAKCGDLEAAQRIFNNILERDVFTWNSMIGGFLQAGYCGKAHDLFAKMHNSGVKRNVITWNVMISGYMKNGDEDQAMELFQKMETDGIKRNTATWNSLIAGSLQNGNENKSLGIFRQMQSACMRSNSVTVLSVLPACANLLAAHKVKEIHGCVLHGGLDSEVPIANALIDTYAKSGDMVSAQVVFDALSCKDLISWNTLLSGYVLHGHSACALDLFDHMKREGVKPNQITCASMISSYSIAGMVDDGKQLFSNMNKEHQISPGLEHYAAMVDLFGRSGKLREAVDFIEKMPIEPDLAVWAALLTACRVHGNLSLATHAAENLIKLEPGNSIVHRLLLQMYNLGGKSDDALRLKKPKKRNRIAGSLGCSWTEIKNTVHTFVVGDRAMPNSDAFYAQLDSVGKETKVAMPNVPHTQLHIDEEDEEIAGIHSEKQAIAFALISAPTSISIRIIKNLRMCVDCHNAAKLISRVYGREIKLKDPACFHHFKDGQCSCRDYW